MKKLLVLFAVFAGLYVHAVEPAKLKKISIVKTNNSAFFLNDGRLVYRPFDVKYLTQLKAYVQKHGLDLAGKTDREAVFTGLAWVNAQWKHDGMNEAPKKFTALDILKSVHQDGKQYRCVEYGFVLSEVLQSFGFITRSIGMRSVDVAYGGFGQGHVATEIWVNDLDKWIFVDPQFGLYLTKGSDDVPLNFYEIAAQRAPADWKQVQVHFVKAAPPTSAEVADYKEFLSQYFGSMEVGGSKGEPKIAMLLAAPQASLTFQGFPTSNMIFTKSLDEIYPPMNRVSLLLNYQDDGRNMGALMKDVETNEKYLQKMPDFAAIPKFKVTFKTTMPLFAHYEYRFTDKEDWRAAPDDTVPWDATATHSSIEVRGLNKLGRPGPVTYMDLEYL